MILIVDSDEPPVFVAVTVNVMRSCVASGMPQIVPFATENCRPLSNSGLTLNPITSPPLEIASILTSVTFEYNTNSSSTYSIIGGSSTTSIVKDTDCEPPLLFAQIVYVCSSESSVGIPEIDPVSSLKVRPRGNSGWRPHSTTSPPVIVIVNGAITSSIVNVISVTDIEGVDGTSTIVMVSVSVTEPPVLFAQIV